MLIIHLRALTLKVDTCSQNIVRGRSQTMVTSFCLLFDHQPPFVDSFYLMKVDIYGLPSTYPPLHVNVFCERPLMSNHKG